MMVEVLDEYTATQDKIIQEIGMKKERENKRRAILDLEQKIESESE